MKLAFLVPSSFLPTPFSHCATPRGAAAVHTVAALTFRRLNKIKGSTNGLIKFSLPKANESPQSCGCCTRLSSRPSHRGKKCCVLAGIKYYIGDVILRFLSQNVSAKPVWVNLLGSLYLKGTLAYNLTEGRTRGHLGPSGGRPAGNRPKAGKQRLLLLSF